MDHLGIRRTLTSLIAGLLVFGTCGYVLIEGWSVVDGFYMTIITLSTVGYGETRELSQTGRLFTSILIAISVVSMAGWTAAITSMLVSGDLSGAFRRRKELRMIAKMKNHTIVCGGGIMGRTVIDQLVKEEKDVVAIVKDAEQVAQIRRQHPEVPIIEDEPK